MTDSIALHHVSKTLSRPRIKLRKNRTTSRSLRVERATVGRKRTSPLDSGAPGRSPPRRTSDAQARVTVVKTRRTATHNRSQMVAPKMVTTVRRTIQAIPDTVQKKGTEFREAGNFPPDEAESLRPPRGETRTRNPKMSQHGAGRVGRSWRS